MIEPELIRKDAFDDFLRTRAGRLLDLIEDATGKPIPGRDSEEVSETFGGSLVAPLIAGLEHKVSETFGGSLVRL